MPPVRLPNPPAASEIALPRPDAAPRSSRTDAPPPTDTTRVADRLLIGTIVLAIVPIAVAVIRALHRGWIVVGDNALIFIRTWDVFTEHHPLLGTWSSASLTAGGDVHHPGPLLFDVLALPTRLGNGSGGFAVGVAILNALAVVGIAVFARRQGGPIVAAAAVMVTAVLTWAMGSELLYEPWQPHVLLLPFLCFLIMVWSVACGDLVALPWAVGAGSLLVQTHLSYAFLVPILLAWAIVVLALELRRVRRDDADSWPDRRRRAQWVAAIAGIVFVASWIQPLIQQLTGEEGNLSQLVEGLGGSKETIGFGRGSQLVASVVAVPPSWLRPSFVETFDESAGWRPPSPALTALSLVLLAAVLVACAWGARRRGDRPALLAIATATVGLLGGLLTVGRGPLSFFGITSHQFRWLWPLSAFAVFAVIVVACGWFPLLGRFRRFGRGARDAVWPVGVFAAVTLVFVVLNLPASHQDTQAPAYSIAVASDIADQLEHLEDEGTLRVVLPDAFGDPYGSAVMAELARRGIPFVAAPEWVGQLGERRESTGDKADAVLSLRIGDASLEPPAGARRVAGHTGLTQREQREMVQLEERVGAHIRQENGVELNEGGRRALRDGDVPFLRDQRADGVVAPEALFASRELVYLIEEEFLLVDDHWRPLYERYAELQTRWDKETVAVFLRTLDRDEQ